MRSALRALLISDDDDTWDAILSGTRKVLIREGRLDIDSHRPLLLASPQCGRVVVAYVTQVRYAQAKDVVLEEAIESGSSTKAAFMDSLRPFFPTLRLNSWVTVIRWDKVEGALVESHRQAAS